MSRKPSLLRRLFAPAIARGRGFAHDERGVTAVEFGLLALPFFTLIFAIIETAMMFFAQQVLDSAVEDASRMIKTGRAQTATYDLTAFRNYVCGYTFNLFNCSNIILRVDTISTFAAVTIQPTIQNCGLTTCTWAVTDSYNPGFGRNIIQISAYYRWPLLVVLPYFNLKNQPDNYRLITAIRVFRNEPFSST
jgi:Flp pilus assembly protein TadG